MTDLDTTARLVLTDAERRSLEAAARAAQDGRIRQRELAPGVWVLLPKDPP